MSDPRGVRGGKNDEYASFIATLKEKNDIAEVIGSYIKLERRGYNFWACCPFHHEKTPSFSVNAADQYYHCFGCGVSGDVIGFVKEYENIDFRRAVEILAARAHMEVPAFDSRTQEEAIARKRKRDRLIALMKDAARFYLANLYGGKADAHLEYVSKRGLQPTTLKKFGIGASLDFYALPAHLREKGYTPEELEESGACMKAQDGKLIDAQGGRLIIPIINNMDEVVAFGGRLLVKSDRAKYKNTRDTMLFDKSRNLFNINLVKKLKREGGIPSLIMVEGYMDAISLYQAGFRNVVASMGTSLTKEQARLCKRYSDNILISYDGDFAGQKANLRGLGILREEGLKVRVVPLPEGLDPDDVIKQQGAEGYRKCLDSSMPLIDFRIRAAKEKYDLKTDEKRDFIKEALAIVKESESETEREDLLKRISAEADVSVMALRRDLENAPAAASPPPAPDRPKREEGDGVKKAERFVLAACLFKKPYARDLDLFEFDFRDETFERIAEYVMEGRAEEGGADPGGIFSLIGPDEKLNELADLNDGRNLEGEHAEAFFKDCVRILRRHALEEQIAICSSAVAEATEEERRALIERLAELTKKKNKIK